MEALVAFGNGYAEYSVLTSHGSVAAVVLRDALFI
uniref:Uncharacterized protein n=1 Tax=Rhizophora mucronata TaxID=61149 RepID=A0A2P2QM55_RHIMU